MNGASLPDELDLLKEQENYDPKLFKCPATGKAYMYFRDVMSYKKGYGLLDIPCPDEFMLLWDTEPHADGTRTVLFSDGHIMMKMDEKKFRQQLKTMEEYNREKNRP